MTLIDLQNAINDCDNGLVRFNRGKPRSFLYGNKWYPLHAVINYAEKISGGNIDYNVESALTKLASLLEYVRIQDIQFNNNIPVGLTNMEIIEEAKFINQTLNRLLS